ncbi:MAG: hypothetical protein ACFFDO_00630 [Candidatus Thorarchaeota archaeon]
MSPIITHEDELELVKMEKELAAQLKKVAKWQRTISGSQRKLADNLAKMNIARQILNRIYRDIFKQMKTLAIEHRSNVNEEEVNIFQDIIHANDRYIEANPNYVNAMKDLIVKKEDLAARSVFFANALGELASKRSIIIKKALSIEKTKNKLIEGAKLTELENQLNDSQREFDRAKNIMLKEIEQFLQARAELNDLWLKLKESISEMS